MKLRLKAGESLLIEFENSDNVLDVCYETSGSIRHRFGPPRNYEDESDSSDEFEIKPAKKFDTSDAFIFKIISDHLGVEVENIKMSSLIREDLGADSLDEVELLMGFESEYNIEVDELEASSVSTVEDLVNYIRKHR